MSGFWTSFKATLGRRAADLMYYLMWAYVLSLMLAGGCYLPPWGGAP